MTPSTLQPICPSRLDLEQLNRKFDKAYPKEILSWCATNLPTGLVQASTFNIDDLVITDLFYRDLKCHPPTPVLFVDTLHHFPETLEFVAYAREVYDLDLHIYKVRGAKSRKTFGTKYGRELWTANFGKFHELTHIEPLQRGLKELQAVAWVTAQRRDRDARGSFLPVFEWDEQDRLKIHPLANWSRTESWAYAYEHDMIYHPLHDRGYPNIGDEPLTEMAVAEEEQTECQLPR